MATASETLLDAHDAQTHGRGQHPSPTPHSAPNVDIVEPPIATLLPTPTATFVDGEEFGTLNSKTSVSEKGGPVLASERRTSSELEEGKAEVVSAPPYFPNGGRQAYLTTAGGVLVLFSTFGLSNSYAAFQAEWTNNQLSSYPPSSISWIGSVHLFILFALGLPAGRLFDRGYFRYQLAVGSVLWVGGVFALSASKTYVQFFLSFAVCLGLGLGTMFSPTLSCVASYFSTRRTLMMGCTAGGAALGATIFPILANHLFATQGFAAGVRALGYIHLGCLLLANILMRPRSDLPPQKPPPALPLILSFLRQPETWFASGGSALTMIGLFIPIFYIQVFAESHHLAPVVITYGLSILNGSACVARLTVGLLADRVGNLTTAVPVTALIGIMVFVLMGATSTAGAIAFCVIFGAASGAYVTIMVPSLISLSANVREFGTRAGLGMIFVACASLAGAPVAGAILRSKPSGDNYLGVCLFGGCSTLIGSALLAAARWKMVKRRGTWRV